MSGRSAYVRAKNTERADKNSLKIYSESRVEDHYPYNYPTGSPSIPTVSTNPSYISSPHISRRRHSVSSSGSLYAYPPQLMRKPRPIVVATAIEKSEFRTHFDSLSSTVREKFGRLLKGGEDHLNSMRRRQDLVNMVIQSRRNDFPPSVDAVPSLSPSTSPEAASFPQAIRQPPAATARVKHREAVINKIRRFEGGGKLPDLGWKSLSSNPELWDENGDTFVYMYMRGSRTKPPPSFKINSQVIKESGSKIFTDKLFHTAEPEGWPRFYSRNYSSRSISSAEQYEDFRNMRPSSEPRSDADTDSLRPLHAPQKNKSRALRGIHYEIYVPWPGAETGIHSTSWHITTRNFFALMYDASALVGTTLYEALSMLFQRISMFPDYLDRNINEVAWITDYVYRHQFDDVRNNPSYAASLLAFSELPGVQWREGYIEAFVHCVGMLNMGLHEIPEWRRITSHTKMFLQNASMEMEGRIHRAQVWLLTFDFTEMWPTSSAPPSPARGCFDRLRKWLCGYYEGVFPHWPATNHQTWLTHDMVMHLKNDFCGLYDYLVDRDVMFSGPEHRSGQKWAITKNSDQNFRADTYELPLTDILTGFDERNNFPHIPHPYPQTPISVPVQGKPKSPFTLKKPVSPTEIQAQSRRKALSYSEASNIYILRNQSQSTELISKFITFEQGDMLDSVDPFEARRGRWLLIYGILQVLATVSVDSPNLRYKEDCQYHLSPQMKGIVPWADAHSPAEEEAEHTRSHCWIVPSTWAAPLPKVRQGAHQPILLGQFGDGRTHGEDAETVLSPRSRGKDANSVRKRPDNIGRKRAEEWVASGGNHMDLRTDQHTDRPHDGLTRPDIDMNDEGHVEETSGSGRDCESVSSTAARRKTLTSDFTAPRGW